jgi:hypothetical protein
MIQLAGVIHKKTEGGTPPSLPFRPLRAIVVKLAGSCGVS